MTSPEPTIVAARCTAESRWAQALERDGHTQATVRERRAALSRFCTRVQLTSEELVDRWLEFPELTVRRRQRCGEQPDLAVESFLIHNGVNVFGDIVCVAGRPEDLATQGLQFVPRGRP